MRISSLLISAFGTVLSLPALAAEPSVEDLQRTLEEQRQQLEATAEALEELRGKVAASSESEEARKGLIPVRSNQ